ncbi:MAG: TonB-dependent receptor [Chitinophagaceae bacterium]|nr:TonB-dependent receptor [Chitinophagaceae bacterium]
MRLLPLPVIMVLLLTALSTFAQNKRLTGKVTSTDKQPLAGVSIQLKGTNVATSSSDNGSFSISVPSSGPVILVFSSVGYEMKELSVTGEGPLDVQLKGDAKSLTDVVVVGYGTQRKADLTGSVASLRGDKLREMPVVSVEQAMSGRMPGVQVQQTSGQPGAGISIRVRGVSSIAGGNEPLYVIDGLPQFNDDVRGVNGLATINPSDIESIEVLKDAAATAIYGSRGANGVVMVTTRSGRAGVPRVVFDHSVGIQTLRKKLDLMNSEEWYNFTKAYYVNSGLALPADFPASVPTVSTDWQDETFRTALLLNNSISVSGGNEKSRYYISGSYFDQQGIVRNSGYKRGSIRINLDNKLSDIFSIATRLTVSRGVQNGFSPSQGDNTRNFGKSGMGSVLRAVPTVPVRNADGSYSDVTPYGFNGIDAENPVALADETLDRNTTTRMQGGVDLKATIIKGLTNTTRVSGDYYQIRRDLYFPRILPRLGQAAGVAELGNYDKTSVLLEDFLEYKKDLTKDIALEAIAGMSYQHDRLNTADLLASGFVNDDLKNYSFSSATTVSKPVTNTVETTILSAFGRIRFNVMDRYLISASIRRDGASVFAENNKYGVFPSVSAAWRISEENFMKRYDWISNLKIRGSWGESGNPAIKPYQSLLLGRAVNTSQGGGTGLVVGLAPTFPNPNLKWETTAQTNIGLDLGLLNERIHFSFDYYVKKTKDLLALVQLPPSGGVGAGVGTGPSQIIDNVGEVQNKGWEIGAGATLFSNDDWSISIDMNLSGNKNKVVKTLDNKDVPTQTGGDDASGAVSIIRAGYPLSVFYAPKFTGLDKDGIPMYENLNGDSSNGRPVINAADNQIIGSPYPDLTYGFTPTIRYKRFTLTSVWAGVSGGLINNRNLVELTNPSPVNQFNKLRAALDLYPKPSQAAANEHRTSNRFLEDGSFFRLRNIRLDYQVPLHSKAIKNLNVYVSAQNLLTWTKYSGYDPEVNSFNGNDRRQGVDLAAYPSSKTFNLGFSLTF